MRDDQDQAVTVSMLNLSQANDDARWLGLMRGQLRKVRIAPVGNAYHLSALGFHSRNLEQLQHVEPPGVEKEGVLSKEFAELRDCRMILSKPALKTTEVVSLSPQTTSSFRSPAMSRVGLQSGLRLTIRVNLRGAFLVGLFPDGGHDFFQPLFVIAHEPLNTVGPHPLH